MSVSYPWTTAKIRKVGRKFASQAPRSPTEQSHYSSPTGARATGTQNFTLTHHYLDNNVTGTASDTYTISASVQDKDLAVGTATTTVTVNNVAPTLVLNTVTAIVENGVATLTGTITITVRVRWTLQAAHSLECGRQYWRSGRSHDHADTSQSDNVSPGVWTFTASHRYLDDNKTGTSGDTYRISVRANDDDAGVVSESTTFVVKKCGSCHYRPRPSSLYA